MMHISDSFKMAKAVGLLVMSLAVLSASAQSQNATPPLTNAPLQAERVQLPKPTPDPLEPANRVLWGFNRGLMSGVVKPSAKGYRFVVRKPLRIMISNVGRNVTFPARVLNNVLQGRWTGAGAETWRFACNSVVGVGGLFDVASEWDIKKSDADFGQTLGKWGWNPQFYLMLPIFGPSNDRDLIGLGADSAANPLTYFTPYPLDPKNPFTYVGPYTYFSYAETYNKLSDSVDDYVRFARSEADPYVTLEYAWGYARKPWRPELRPEGEPDEASLETLQSAFVAPQNPKFFLKGKTRSATIPATKRKLKYTFWLQPQGAPVVYILPGLGSHRLAQTVLALAELAYRNGYSVVCLSSSFHPEFMEHAASTALPGFAPVDVQDVRAAITQIDTRFSKAHPGLLGPRALMGYSMGGFQCLLAAATQATNRASGIQFDRFVAIDTPVRLMNGIAKLDELYNAALAWPVEEQPRKIETTLLKVAALTETTNHLASPPPFGAIESRFLIGLNFRFILRDTIYSSQSRHNQGVLKRPLKDLHRAPVYEEILRYSYGDYLRDFLVPYYAAQGIDLHNSEALEQASDLRSYASGLSGNERVRVIVNDNDFLLSSEDLGWLRQTFSPGQLTTFAHGGHLGNLGEPAVQAAIVRALQGQ